MIYRELLDSLGNLKWPTVTCESVPWASHTPRCKLQSWSSVTSAGNGFGSMSVGDVNQGQDSENVDARVKNGASKEETETIKEDGELPSLVPIATGANDGKLTPSEGSEIEHSGRLGLISTSIISPLTNKGKSPSFKRQDDDIDLMLESENEDELIQVEEQSDNVSRLEGPALIDNEWAEYGITEYSLALFKKLDNDDRNMILKAKVSSMIVLFIHY